MAFLAGLGGAAAGGGGGLGDLAKRPTEIATGVNLGILGLGQGLLNIRAGREARERNRQALADLQQREQAGALGLLGGERRALEQQLLTPIQQSALAARQRAEQIGASQTLTGAQLAQLRQEQALTTGAGAQQAAGTIAQASMQRAAVERQEIEQRIALQEAQRKQVQASIFDPLITAAGVAGGVQGAVPEFGGVSGSSVTPEQRSKLDEFQQNASPEEKQAFARALGQPDLSIDEIDQIFEAFGAI